MLTSRFHLFLCLVPCLAGASPLFNIRLDESPLEAVAHAFERHDQDYLITYDYSSVPGPDFFDYRDDLGISYGKETLGLEELTRLNSHASTNELRFNANAFHLKYRELANKEWISKERTLFEGRIIDFFPNRPSAYLRAEGFVRHRLSLFDFLAQFPYSLDALRAFGSAAGWAPNDSLTEDILHNGEWKMQTPAEPIIIQFYHRLQQFPGSGYGYRLEFEPRNDSNLYRIRSSQVNLAHFNASTQQWVKGEPFINLKFLNYGSGAFPKEVRADLYRSQRNNPSAPYKRYHVRRVKFTINSFAAVSETTNLYHIEFPKGTFITDEQTGKKWKTK